jgi:hypothetical protein
VDSKTSHLLLWTRRHGVIFAGNTTHAYRTVCCTARIAERIVHLLRTFLNWIMADHGICEVECIYESPPPWSATRIRQRKEPTDPLPIRNSPPAGTFCKMRSIPEPSLTGPAGRNILQIPGTLHFKNPEPCSQAILGPGVQQFIAELAQLFRKRADRTWPSQIVQLRR